MAYKDKVKYQEYQKKWKDNHKSYIKEYNKTKGKESSKRYYKRNRDIILNKLRQNYPLVKSKSNLKSKDYYEKNKEKILKRKKAYFQISEVKQKANIRQKSYRLRYKDKNLARDKTKYYFPLVGHNCEFCGNKATGHHHYTIPYQYDKFWFVCKECHLIKDKELKRYINGNN